MDEMTSLGLRKRWRGMARRRLMALRGRIDRRIERLEEKQQALRIVASKRGQAYEQRGARPAAEEPVPVTGPAIAVEEAKRPARRRASRRRTTP
jgi:hypothetical protein